MSEQGRRYLVADFGFGYDGHVVTAVWVRAESPDEAASVARAALEADTEDSDPGYPERVVVIDASELAWFDFEKVPRRLALSCCGGMEFTDDGHTGHCDERPGSPYSPEVAA